jgi:hypothetical protein
MRPASQRTGNSLYQLRLQLPAIGTPAWLCVQPWSLGLVNMLTDEELKSYGPKIATFAAEVATGDWTPHHAASPEGSPRAIAEIASVLLSEVKRLRSALYAHSRSEVCMYTAEEEIG